MIPITFKSAPPLEFSIGVVFPPEERDSSRSNLGLDLEDLGGHTELDANSNPEGKRPNILTNMNNCTDMSKKSKDRLHDPAL